MSEETTDQDTHPSVTLVRRLIGLFVLDGPKGEVGLRRGSFRTSGVRCVSDEDKLNGEDRRKGEKGREDWVYQ